ncbi:glycerophosphodiester phosphodiesterase [Flavobacteriales bacterium]|nr:glycerophosphodiester phosphodiesterase [Flavobacteriales bacterium]
MKQPLLLLGLIVFLGCSNHPEPSQSIEASTEDVQENYAVKNREFDLQGHRGARGLFPENSLEGFISAVDLMVNTIEMDVVISKDKQVVVSHEPWISSTICWGRNDKPVAEGKGLNIYQMNYDQVTNYNCGSEPHPDFPLQAKFSTFKPLLSEVIAEVESNAAALEIPAPKYNIEIKSMPEGDDIFHPKPTEFCELVLAQINEANIHDKVIIQSFDVRALQASKQLDASIPVALLVSETNGFEKDLEKLGFTPEIYSPNFRLVDEEMVRSCHQNNIQIIPWTVNEEEDMEKLLDLGVDGLITDYPDVALTLKM